VLRRSVLSHSRKPIVGQRDVIISDKFHAKELVQVFTRNRGRLWGCSPGKVQQTGEGNVSDRLEKQQRVDDSLITSIGSKMSLDVAAAVDRNLAAGRTDHVPLQV
jgi:hypothetical protein